MRKNKSFSQSLFYLFLALTMINCSKESMLSPSEMDGLSSEALELRAGTLTISPSGDPFGTTDTDAIENALNSPGIKKVALSAGTFYINRPIMAPAGFEGSLKGQGKNATFIEGVGTPGKPFSIDLIPIQLSPYPVQSSTFFYFPDPAKSLTISDLSLSISSGFIAEASDFDGTENLTSFITVKLGTNVADVTMRNISLTGTDASAGSPNWYFSQPNFGAVVLGDRDAGDFPQPSNAGGKIKVQNSHISKTSYQALIFEVLKEAKVTISQNTFTDTKQINIRFLDDCKVTVQNNNFHTISWGSIVITQEFALGYGPIAGAPTDVKIQGNQINSEGFLGVEIGAIPFPGAAPFNILVEGNMITKSAAPLGGGNLAGIGIYEGHANAVVQQNTILGEADYGILLVDVDNSLIFQNITSGLTPFTADYGLIGPSDGNQLSVTHPATAVDEGTANVFSGPVTILP